VENGSGPSQSHRDRGTKVTDEEQGCHGENVGALGALGALQRMPARAPHRGNNIILSRKAAKDAKKPTPGTLPHRSDAIGQTETSPHTRTATEKWINYPSLRLGPGRSRGKGRIQRQLRRAFIARGNEISSSDAYRWCKRWQSREFGHWERWSITRVLMTMADRVGRAQTIGRPWLWRLKQENTS
jgi:hypothetical protein